MKFTYATVAAFAAAAVALPATPVEERGILPSLLPSLLPGLLGQNLFTDLTCTIDKALTPGQPLQTLFPTADAIGQILGPKLSALIGNNSVQAIDLVAEDICISANQDPEDGNGICNNILLLVNQLVVHTAPEIAHRYRCLLNAICVANPTPANKGTCQFLLAGVDCVANRIVGVGDKECTPDGPNSNDP